MITKPTSEHSPLPLFSLSFNEESFSAHILILFSNEEGLFCCSYLAALNLLSFLYSSGQLVLLAQARNSSILSSPVKWGASVYLCDQVGAINVLLCVSILNIYIGIRPSVSCLTLGGVH